MLTKHKYFHDNIFTYLFWQSLVCYVIPDIIVIYAWFVNMVFSDIHTILIKKIISVEGI